jgi:hypothetical protein
LDHAAHPVVPPAAHGPPAAMSLLQREHGPEDYDSEGDLIGVDRRWDDDDSWLTPLQPQAEPLQPQAPPTVPKASPVKAPPPANAVPVKAPPTVTTKAPPPELASKAPPTVAKAPPAELELASKAPPTVAAAQAQHAQALLLSPGAPPYPPQSIIFKTIVFKTIVFKRIVFKTSVRIRSRSGIIKCH